MSHHFPPHLKRLQHDVNLNLHSHNHHSQQSNNSHTNSFDHRTHLPNDEAIRESIQHFTISATNRSVRPGPQQARRGGGRPFNRPRNSSLSLPKRAINYDLAESFVDHSTNPLSSDLYKIKFKHSPRQWPNGRFMNYKEKLDKLDGKIIEITCTRAFPLVPKRKQTQGTNQNEHNDLQTISTTTTTTSITSSLPLPDPVVQEEKKKQVDKQANVYASLFGGGRIPRISSTTQVKKADSTINSTSSTSAPISLLGETSTDHQS